MGRILYTPPEPHRCTWPGIASFNNPDHTIAQCHCGQIWEYVPDEYGSRWTPRSLRWLKRHHPTIWTEIHQPPPSDRPT